MLIHQTNDKGLAHYGYAILDETSKQVILIDPAGMTGYELGVEMMGTGVIVVGLTAGYYLIKKAGITIGTGGENQDRKE